MFKDMIKKWLGLEHISLDYKKSKIAYKPDVAIFSAFVVGYSINTHEANIKDVVKQTPQDILFVTFCIGMICGILLEAVILLKR